jgi:proline iminopeptidase
MSAALALTRIEAHYFVNDVFLKDSELLRNVRRLRHIPAIFIQGRYDMVCPIVTADALARAWPEAKYVIIPDAGHSAMEPGIRAALVRAAEAMNPASADVSLQRTAMLKSSGDAPVAQQDRAQDS